VAIFSALGLYTIIGLLRYHRLIKGLRVYMGNDYSTAIYNTVYAQFGLIIAVTFTGLSMGIV
jgi:hypothetical protein